MNFSSSAIIAFIIFAISLRSNFAHSEQISEYICGTDTQNGVESTNVGITLLDNDLLIQAIGKHEDGKLKTVAGVISSLRTLNETKYGRYTPDQLLSESDSPLARLGPKQKSYLRNKLVAARSLQATQTLTPGKAAIFDVVLVERQDSYGKLLWTVETKKTIVDKEGRLKTKGADDTFTVLTTDDATGLMIATSYLKFPGPETHGESYFSEDSSAVMKSWEDATGPSPNVNELVRSPLRIGDKLLPRVGENIGKHGTMTFEAKLDNVGELSEVQFRVANLELRREKKDRPGSVLELLSARKATFIEYAACCKNDSPADCTVRFRPAAGAQAPLAKPRSTAPSAPTKH